MDSPVGTELGSLWERFSAGFLCDRTTLAAPDHPQQTTGGETSQNSNQNAQGCKTQVQELPRDRNLLGV